MKIIHCADIHLDSNVKDPSLSVKQRNHEIRNTFIRMLDYASANGVHAIVIAGDLFDSDVISVKTRDMLLEQFKKRSEIQFYYLRGNHDTIHVLGNEKLSNLNTFSNHLKIYKTMLPNGRCISISGMELEASCGTSFYDRIKLDARDFNILCLHGQVKDYASEEEIGLNQLENRHIHYLALGHVHKFSKGRLAPNGMYAYSGCLEGRGFDDTGEHGFILLDIDENTFSYTMKFVRFAGRKIIRLEIDVTEIFSYNEVMEQILSRAKIAGMSKADLLKVDLVGESFEHAMELDYLEEDLKKHFHQVRVNNKIKKREADIDYRYDVSLRGEFTRLVLAEADLSEAMKMSILECGMELLNEEY